MLLIPTPSGDESSTFVPWGGNDVKAGGDPLDAPEVQTSAERYASVHVEVIDSAEEVLAVLQGEVAVAQPGDGPSALASDSATTCHIVGFRHSTSGRTCLAHLDNPHTVSEAIGCMMNLVFPIDIEVQSARAVAAPAATATAHTEPLDVYIVGGYLGESLAEDIRNALLLALHSSHRVFRLVLACMSRLNSKWFESTAPGRSVGTGTAESCGQDDSKAIIKSGAQGTSPVGSGRNHSEGRWLPRQTGLGIDVASGRAFPVRLEGAARGPGWATRHSRIFAGAGEEVLAQIYDSRSDSIVVAPFALFVNPAGLLRVLALPDGELLKLTSTSPDAEDERFVADVRSQYSYVLAHAGEDGRSWWEKVFGGGRGHPLVYPRVASTTAEEQSPTRGIK